jgi:hypothetical protein
MKKEKTVNGSYFVFEMAIRDRKKPIRQVNSKPLALDAAKQLARIGATEGKHDRAVTTNPRSRGFQVVAQYEAGSGQNVTQALRANRLPPGKVQRRTTRVVAAEIEETGPLSQRMPETRPMVDSMGWKYDPVTGAPLSTTTPRLEHTGYENVDEDGSPLQDWDD